MPSLEKPDNSSMNLNPENLNKIDTEQEYFRQMKLFAHQKRADFSIGSKKICLSLVRQIYKSEKVIIDYVDFRSPRIRAVYCCDSGNPSVGVKKSLPVEPKLFSLLHELKHHLVDRQGILNNEFVCGDYNENKKIEVGAEVFAAEFIFPESAMLISLNTFGISKATITPEQVVEYKRSCGVSISYIYILKRLEFFKIIEKNAYEKIAFKKLEEKLHPPIYKQQWFTASRQIKRK